MEWGPWKLGRLELPNVGDYVQTEGTTRNGRVLRREGFVSRVDQFGFQLQPEPNEPVGGVRWRRRIVPPSEDVTREAEKEMEDV